MKRLFPILLCIAILFVNVLALTACGGKKPQGGEESCEHLYDNVCDADCNTCGATRTPTACVDEANGADGKCDVCGKDMETIGGEEHSEHVYDNACDADCNTCGVTRTPAECVDEGANGKCDVCGKTVLIDGSNLGDDVTPGVPFS